MHRYSRFSPFVIAAAAATLAAATAAQVGAETNRAVLRPTSTNPYFSLQPGLRLTYAQGKSSEVVTVLDKIRLIDGVQTRAVEDREWKNGQLTEITLDYYAGDPRTGDVYYFGEDATQYQNGRVVGHKGSWLSGVHGARFGLMMPGHPSVGQSYFEEQAPGVDLDRGTIVSLDKSVNVPAGHFRDCVYVRGTNAREPGAVEYKWYSRSVGGPVKDAEMDLTRVERSR